MYARDLGSPSVFYGSDFQPAKNALDTRQPHHPSSLNGNNFSHFKTLAR